MLIKQITCVSLSLYFLSSLTACSDNSSSDKENNVITQSYELTFSNLTSNQPMSPLAISIHGADYTAWTIGEKASVGLETLAESGNGKPFLVEASNAGAHLTTMGAGLVLPGQEELLELNADYTHDLMLSFATMMVNTNDGFVGVQKLDISNLEINEAVAVFIPVYDAGTEKNSELADTIPGPADNGEGFNAIRDDVNVVARHPGVVTHEEGYNESVLDSTHRFDSPAAKLRIKRTQ